MGHVRARVGLWCWVSSGAPLRLGVPHLFLLAAPFIKAEIIKSLM